ncbi:MAG: acetate kinase [Candidatus Woesearchaeota archaeon]
MKILVLNSGSSSLKYQLLEMPEAKLLLKGHVDGIGLDTCKHIVNDSVTEVKVTDHHMAVGLCLETLREYYDLREISCVGHRVVHGGEFFSTAALIDDGVLKKIEDLKQLAPLHNPPNLQGIYASMKLLPGVKQGAVFDTAFHQSLPEKAFLYGLPYNYYQEYKIRKYGFHGTSHKYVANKANEILGKNLKVITCHLGNGASIAAIKDTRSVDTTMGFTPLQGLMMGTRSGDLDPEVVAFLAEKLGVQTRDVITILNKKSGFFGLCGTNDVRIIYERASKGDARCKLALDMFAYRVGLYVAAYNSILGGADAIVFTAGIGEKAWYVREDVCGYLANLGVKLDEVRNKANELIISSADSSIKVMVIPTNEEVQIARECLELCK